jgi:hypothetical protein
MNPRIKHVKAKPNSKLNLGSANGEEKVFDCGPHRNPGIFRVLKERQYFEQVFVFDAAVAWRHGQNFCPDTLYTESA